MARLLAIDPGPVKSGWVLMDGEKPCEWGWDENLELRERIRAHDDLGVWDECLHCAGELAIEVPQPRGMPTAKEEMDTLIEIGRFIEVWFDENYIGVSRHAVKITLCGHVSAKDANIRQAIIDRFGGDSVAIGGKKCQNCKGKGWRGRGRPVCSECVGSGYETPPGPLHGVSGHVWSALAVGITWMEQQK